MEFPSDIWNHVFSFLPAVYRRPNHYTAMMGTETFCRCRMTNRNPFARNVIESFYMRTVVSTAWYWAYPEIQWAMIAPELVFRHGVASGSVRDEFARIYEEYTRLFPPLTPLNSPRGNHPNGALSCNRTKVYSTRQSLHCIRPFQVGMVRLSSGRWRQADFGRSARRSIPYVNNLIGWILCSCFIQNEVF